MSGQAALVRPWSAVGRRHATIWLVVSTTYPPTQPACSDLLAALRNVRTARLMIADDLSVADHSALWRFAAND